MAGISELCPETINTFFLLPMLKSLFWVISPFLVCDQENSVPFVGLAIDL